MGFLTGLNRSLWVLIGVLLVGFAAAHGWLLRTTRLPEAPGIAAVPPASVAQLPPPANQPLLQRNPFAADGRTWSGRAPRQAVATQHPSGHVPKADAIRGLVRFASFAGAITSEGFVAKGETLEGAVLKTVTQDGAAFSLGDDKEVLLQPPQPDSKGKAQLRAAIQIKPLR